MSLRSLAGTLFLLAAMSPRPAEPQGPRRPMVVGFTRDTLSHEPTPDSTSTAKFRLLLKPAAQDSSRECQASYPYVLLGGLVGAVVGSARYEKKTKDDYGEFDIPWLSMPLIIGPFVLGGMLLGYLFAPC